MEYFFNSNENYEKPMLEEIALCASGIFEGSSKDNLGNEGEENEETA